MIVSANFIGATGGVLNSILKNQKKRVLMMKLIKVDRLFKHLKITVDYQQFNKQIQKRFYYNFLFFISFSLFLIVSTLIYSPQFLFYILQLHLLLHFIQMHCLYVLIFLWTIDHRMELLCDLVKNSDTTWDSNSLFVLKLIIMHLLEIIKEFRNVFGLSLFASLFQIYMSVLINSYWLSMAFLDLPDAYFQGINRKFKLNLQILRNVTIFCISDVVLFGLPNAFILLNLARTGTNIDKHVWINTQLLKQLKNVFNFSFSLKQS